MIEMRTDGQTDEHNRNISCLQLMFRNLKSYIRHLECERMFCTSIRSHSKYADNLI